MNADAPAQSPNTAMPVAAELHVVLLHEDPAGSRSNSAVREGQSRQRLDRPESAAVIVSAGIDWRPP
ncbi:hypothetical protein BZL30_4163 [Mycobacterium kansasii]|uniref:Uncharacterized protein n=1 Tax=Mycobacterium kansasii TaxID=1768 RepID=A0A1V3XCP6_MYCKA|nr:hypothetical protein BZL30_4163 [Mycobacterium kansasii]